MWMLVLAFGLGAYAGAAWVLSTAAKAYGQRELSFWNAVSALVVARLATKGLSALLPKQDALTNIAISMSVYGAIVVGVLWLWCGLSLLRALGIGLALTLALLIGTVVVVATLL